MPSNKETETETWNDDRRNVNPIWEQAWIRKPMMLFEKFSVLFGILVIYEAVCVDMAQGRKNGPPNMIQTYSCRFASLAC